MTNKWVVELQHLSSWYGFTPDAEMRERNLNLHRPLERLGPDWLKAHDHITDSAAIDPDLAGSPEETAFLSAPENFSAIDRMLYNAGVTSVLVEGSIRDEIDRSGERNNIGIYSNYFNTATTSALVEKMDNDETVASVTRHETGHAFSFNAAPLKPLQSAMYQELRTLSGQTLEDSANNQLGPFIEDPSFFRPSGSGWGRDIDITYLNSLAESLNRNPEIRQHMPVTTSMLEDINYFTEDGSEPEEIKMRLSEHDYIVDAYQKDLLAIINGEGPEGARFEVREIDFRGEMQDRACIVFEQNGIERVIDVAHYVPNEFQGNFIGGEKTGDDFLAVTREEAFSEVFEDMTGIMSDSEFAHYFPNMTAEVTEIVAATEILAAREAAFIQRLELGIPAQTVQENALTAQ